MRLLVVTQAVDSEDPVLGFFVRWIDEFSKHFDCIEIICLRAGAYKFPENVRVHSLGKERKESNRIVYVWRFLRLVWLLRHNYDVVFVHMNQEYVLLAGGIWRLLRKPVYLWRNHYAGSWFTNLAVAFCTKVLCTSKYSYTAQFRKRELMPVGVDTDRFSPDVHILKIPRSILSLSRFAPSKRIEMLIDALLLLQANKIVFKADIVGSPLPQHEAYYSLIKKRALPLRANVTFLPGVANSETPDLYRTHEIFVNASRSGMFDKTLFEAAACRCAVLSSSEDFAELAGRETFFSSSEELAARLRQLLGEREKYPLQQAVHQHSLHALAVSLASLLAQDV
jgi:glycosyltransferase involved in cell wall biosynthesis